MPGERTVKTSRWPFCFSLDDLEIQGCIWEWGSGVERLLDAGDRVPGVHVRHRPTGATAVMTAYATRDENLQAALRRLDRHLRYAYAAGKAGSS